MILIIFTFVFWIFAFLNITYTQGKSLIVGTCWIVTFHLLFYLFIKCKKCQSSFLIKDWKKFLLFGTLSLESCTQCHADIGKSTELSSNYRTNTARQRLLSELIDNFFVLGWTLCIPFYMPNPSCLKISTYYILSNLLGFTYHIISKRVFGKTIGNFIANIKVVRIRDEKMPNWWNIILFHGVDFFLLAVNTILAVLVLKKLDIAELYSVHNLDQTIAIIVGKNVNYQYAMFSVVFWYLLNGVIFLINKSQRTLCDQISGLVFVQESNKELVTRVVKCVNCPGDSH